MSTVFVTFLGNSWSHLNPVSIFWTWQLNTLDHLQFRLQRPKTFNHTILRSLFKKPVFNFQVGGKLPLLMLLHHCSVSQLSRQTLNRSSPVSIFWTNSGAIWLFWPTVIQSLFQLQIQPPPLSRANLRWRFWIAIKILVSGGQEHPACANHVNFFSGQNPHF